MDKFTRQMLAETGLLGMVGKAERGTDAIKASRVLAFEDLGMEAIYELTVQDMPVAVAVDSRGTSVHQTGPAEWAARIASTRQLAGTPILGQ